MQTFLILDASNIVYRTFFANLKEDQELTVGLCYQMALNSMNKYYRQYNASNIVVAFDMPNSWRKIYTRTDNEDRITHKLYKGNRRQNLTESQKKRLFDLDNHLNTLSDLFREKTGLITLKRKYLEADDLIAGFVQKFKDDKHIIISSDKDFIQLLDNGNVSLIDPATDTARDLSEWDHDAKYFMFEKCFRGDAGDNVQSSYPNMRSKKIKEAYSNEFIKTNAMNHTFTVDVLDENGKLQTHLYITKKLYEENQLLMDLTKQPDYIRELIDSTIDSSINNRGKYNYLEFVKFCGRYELVNILGNVDKYSALLSGKGKRI